MTNRKSFSTNKKLFVYLLSCGGPLNVGFLGCDPVGFCLNTALEELNKKGIRISDWKTMHAQLTARLPAQTVWQMSDNFITMISVGRGQNGIYKCQYLDFCY